MSWSQSTLTLPSRSRGSYLITDVIEREVPAIKEYKVGLTESIHPAYQLRVELE